MDKVIKTCDSVSIGNGLRICESYGVAFQEDMTNSVEYGPDYFHKYETYRESRRYGEVDSVRANLAKSANLPVVDIGIGCGAFIEQCQQQGIQVLGGMDINPVAVKWLHERELLIESFDKLPTISLTMWDVLEHIQSPHEILDKMRVGDALLVSLPIYNDLCREVPDSKHYRPDEHYYYFTKWGFIKWLYEYGVTVTEYNENETLPNCGRSGIGTFVARKLR